MERAKKAQETKGARGGETEIDITIKLNKKIEIYRDLISRKGMIVDILKCALFAVATICFLRVGFKNTFTKAHVLIYPTLIQALLFGHQSFLDDLLSLLQPEQPSLARYSSPQQEIKYLTKTILFDCFNVLYLVIFVPIYFAPSEVYVDRERYESLAWFYFFINLMYYSILILDKRAFEMQFNAHVMGSWSQVFESETVGINNTKRPDSVMPRVGDVMDWP